MSRSLLTEILSIKHPILMAPMFLVSNVKMLQAGMNEGLAVCIPALNFRAIPLFEEAITILNANKPAGGAFGINLIVNKSNLKYQTQLEVCCRLKPDFIITSLGNPQETIQKAQPLGIKVFCDITDLSYAQKVESLGCDALIAVNNQAGGHRGHLSPDVLISQLLAHTHTPIISAGGVADKNDVERMLALGASGVSVGSPFIACEESDISLTYKQACVRYGTQDIVLTSRLSGTPCSVINTPYVKQIGTKETWLEHLLNKHKKLKKWIKLIRFMKGTQMVTRAATQATYKTVWVAGPSIEKTTEIAPVKTIIQRFI